MIPIQQITGRLGNQMFQYAFFYTYARDNAIDHYYQDPSFFEHRAEEIKQIFGQKIPLKTDMVAIHVRRGDYVGHDFYVNLWRNGYYQRAMKEFPKNTHFLVFSDDIVWCKEHFLGKEFEFSDKDEITDFNLMASCRGHIIANSSFSWWAAYVSPYSMKIIAPSVENWYSDGKERTKCPDNWLRL